MWIISNIAVTHTHKPETEKTQHNLTQHLIFNTYTKSCQASKILLLSSWAGIWQIFPGAGGATEPFQVSAGACSWCFCNIDDFS